LGESVGLSRPVAEVAVNAQSHLQHLGRVRKLRETPGIAETIIAFARISIR
jgi:hypothetical protein